MGSYTVKQLREEGPPFAMAMLLKCLSSGEPFVTYKSIRDELQYQLGISNIFSTHIGHVAGSLMDKILEIDQEAPLINVLITRPNGFPGKGIGGYFAKKYGNNEYINWNKLKKNKKQNIIERERDEIFHYPNWDSINDKLFGKNAVSKLRSSASHDSGSGESYVSVNT